MHGETPPGAGLKETVSDMAASSHPPDTRPPIREAHSTHHHRVRHRPTTTQPAGTLTRARLAALPTSTIWPLPAGAALVPVAARIAAACTPPGALVALVDPPTVGGVFQTRDGQWAARLVTAVRAVAEFGRRPLAVLDSRADADRLTTALAEDHQRSVPIHVTGHHPGPQADLAITAICPHPRLAPVITAAAGQWARLLAPGGILAVHIRTATDSNGQLLDPTGEVVTAAQHAGLHYLQHIIALRVPITDGQLQVEPTPAQQASLRHAAVLGWPARHLPVHEDLVLFTRTGATRPAWTQPEITAPADDHPAGQETRHA